MRLHCEVEVRSCHLPTLGLKSRGKGVRAVVSLCQSPGRNELEPGARTKPGHCACLLVSTMKDKQGTRYQVLVRSSLTIHTLLTSAAAFCGLVDSDPARAQASDTAAEQLYEMVTSPAHRMHVTVNTIQAFWVKS